MWFVYVAPVDKYRIRYEISSSILDVRFKFPSVFWSVRRHKKSKKKKTCVKVKQKDFRKIGSGMSSSAGPDPSRYFSSHGGLSDSLDSAGDVMDGHGRPSGEFKKRLDSVRARLLASFESGAPEERRNLTVYTGRAGYAYMYHRLALIGIYCEIHSKRPCEEELPSRRLFFFLSDEHNRSDHLAKAESHLSPCLKRLSGSRISFLCGDPGPLALGAAVASLKVRSNKKKKTEEDFWSSCSHPPTLLGRLREVRGPVRPAGPLRRLRGQVRVIQPG